VGGSLFILFPAAMDAEFVGYVRQQICKGLFSVPEKPHFCIFILPARGSSWAAMVAALL
jgi:hypothetical protein